MSDGAICIPNFSGPGRVRRRRVAIAMLVIGGVLFVALTATHAAPLVRALVGLPVAGAAISYLQVTRNTCIAHARTGTIEQDDFSTLPAPEVQLAASRRVATTIVRDGLLLGLVAGLVSAATAYVI